MSKSVGGDCTNARTKLGSGERTKNKTTITIDILRFLEESHPAPQQTTIKMPTGKRLERNPVFIETVFSQLLIRSGGEGKNASLEGKGGESLYEAYGGILLFLSAP